jgi:hypothetical protein
MRVTEVLAGMLPFGELNRAEKAHLFRTYGPRYTDAALCRRLRASGRTVNLWRSRTEMAA